MTTIDNTLTTTDIQIDTQTDSKPDTMLSVSDVAKLLDLSRGTLYNRIQKANSYESFKEQGERGSNNSVLYPKTLWTGLLEEVGLSFPDDAIEPEIIDEQPAMTGALARFGAVALAHTNGLHIASPESNDETVLKFQELAIQAATDSENFTQELLNAHLLKAQQQGREFGALKAAIFYQAADQAFKETSMGKSQQQSDQALEE